MVKRPAESLEGNATPTGTPKKLRFSDAITPTKSQLATPSKQGRKSKSATPGGTPTAKTTPRSSKAKPKSALVTPSKQQKKNDATAPNPVADRSARRKVNSNLIQRSIEGGASDEEEDPLANKIWDEVDGQSSSGEEQGQNGQEQAVTGTVDPETPSKRGRGRPKGSKNKRTPTPPPDIPPHERYFFENRSNTTKASSTAVSSHTLLSHADYHDITSTHKDPHEKEIADLEGIHRTSFPLWNFELSQGYTVCLFGYGSKRRLLTSFADFLHTLTPSNPPKTIMVNGHHPSLTLRNFLLTIVRSLDISTSGLSTVPSILLSTILNHQNKKAAKAPNIYLLITTIHVRALTAAPAPSILASLAAHPTIRIVLTASNPSFPLLWPSLMRDSLNILFHDATTFLPYDDPTSSVPELGMGVVDSVSELMGKKGQAAASRERVSWVLQSLPENARGLYRILVSEILSADAEGLGDGMGTGLGDGFDSDEEMGAGGADAGGAQMPGIDSKVLYQKASEEFLCSSEMAFRGLLREFLDHAMVVVRRDVGSVGGGEVLGIDMPREELEGVLEDLVL